MPRLLGLAQASNYYKIILIRDRKNSLTEVMKLPSVLSEMLPLLKVISGKLLMPQEHYRFLMIMSIWDDGYGISVSTKTREPKKI